MRPWLILVAAACSPSREQPPPPSHQPEPRHSIDVTVRDAPVAIRGVELTPGPKHSLELGYRLEAQDKSVSIPGEIMCRVQGYNLVYPAATTTQVAGARLTGVWRPDPFSEEPEICQVDWWLKRTRVAAACYAHGKLVDGACPGDTFTWDDNDGIHAIQLSHAKLEFREGAAVMTGVFTVVDRVPEHHVARISCGDSGGPIVGEAAMPLLPLDRIGGGASVFGPVAILLDRSPRPLAACTFTIVAAGGKGEVALAEYCATTEAVRLGRCDGN